jgi:hypothetical protein
MATISTFIYEHAESLLATLSMGILLFWPIRRFIQWKIAVDEQLKEHSLVIEEIMQTDERLIKGFDRLSAAITEATTENNRQHMSMLELMIQQLSGKVDK